MPAQKTLYGMVAILIFLLAVSATIGAYYYVEYSQLTQTNSSFASQLNTAGSKYNETVSEYNSLVKTYGNSLNSYEHLAELYNQSVLTFNSLSSNFSSLSSYYNRTLTLLVATVSVLNTSEPAYQNASQSLTLLWNKYDTLKSSYEEITNQFESLFVTFQSQITSYEKANNVTLGNLLIPVEPISSKLLSANFVIQFGNSTYKWTNNTQIQAGWNAYVFTLVATGGNVNATWYPQYGEHFVNAIDGVSYTSSQYWFLWESNGTAWQLEQSGADLVPVLNGTSVAWTLCTENANYLPNCAPP